MENERIPGRSSASVFGGFSGDGDGVESLSLEHITCERCHVL
jgi:hypothetical protein